MQELEFHEIANIFPLMRGPEFWELVEDIKANGLREPIVLYEGKILDGRNRFRACSEALVTPRCEEWDGKGSPVDFVVSLNIHRRHMDASQRAMVAARIATLKDGQTKVGAPLGAAVTQPEAAEPLNVSRRAFHRATVVQDHGVPELVDAVVAGEISVSKASRIARLEPEEQAEAIVKPHVAYNSGDNEWYTPTDIVESARKVLGGFDLDPASSEEANKIVRADTFYDEAVDGLTQEWAGRVWMNPPYASSLIGKFVEKFLSYLDSEVPAGIVLVNNATETKWFQSLLANADAVCFPAGRVKFWHPRKVATPLQGQAILYFGGSATNDFIEEFSKYGGVCRVEEF